MTYEDRLIEGLKKMGWHIDYSDRSRYTAFRKEGQQRKLFVGPNGALRLGRTASQSHSIGDATHKTAFYSGILALGTPKEVASLHSLAAEFGMDTDVAKEVV